MKLNQRLLESSMELYDFQSAYNSCFNARGMYDAMQFVLRLRPDIHVKLNETAIGIYSGGEFNFETLQAFSTFLHESIHWWQHIGSTAGFIVGLTYPAQSHINNTLLKEYLREVGPHKSVLRSSQLSMNESADNSARSQIINQIVNNYHDIEFFKRLCISPRSAPSFANTQLFESMGHSYYIAYSSHINLLSATVDPNLAFLPDARLWDTGFRRLLEKKEVNHYHGSPLRLAPIGLRAIFEGQARFSQIQYLYFASGGRLRWDDFAEIKMLSGVYVEAFEAFLKLTDSDWPNTVDDPVVALFLLICDLAINPTEGFPFDILNFEAFLPSVEPGMRFCMLCRTVATKHPHLKSAVSHYSCNEYREVAEQLSSAIICPSPLAAATHVCSWVIKDPTMARLMEEEKSFNFSDQNLPVRVLLSRFVQFQRDKLKNPEIFCWPGAHTAGERCSEDAMQLFLAHQSLFADKADGDIYPRVFPDKDEGSVQKTFDSFYVWVSVYDLCRQWISHPGRFKYDYFWLTSKYSMKDLEGWAKHNFSIAYGIDPDEFLILD